jgi:hypothetical protein
MRREAYLVKREAPDEMRKMRKASPVSEASESGTKNVSRFTNDVSRSGVPPLFVLPRWCPFLLVPRSSSLLRNQPKHLHG